MTWSTRSPSETITGASPSPDEPVVDLPPPRLLCERAVGVVEHAAHVDLLVPNREPVRLQLREIEHVADEPLETVGLGGDDLERRARPARAR